MINKIKFYRILIITVFLIISAICIYKVSNILFSERIITLSRDEILNSGKENYPKNTSILWDEFRQGENDTFDGIIPIEYLDDPVYCSMNLPSESRSETMITAWRDNAHITGFIDDTAEGVLSIGALYTTENITVKDNISVCLGKIKLFAYSKNNQCWEIIDSQPYPAGIYLYKMPWGSPEPSVAPSDIVYTDEYAKITLSPEEINGYCLHFWGKIQEIKEDYIYYACAYEFWIDDPEYSGNDLTAAIGIDAKAPDHKKTTAQLFSSRGLTVSATKKIHWGHTINYSDYNRKRDGDTLVSLFNE